MNPTCFLRRFALPGLFLAALTTGCIEPYVPEVNPIDKDYLVVDGFINTLGVTTIRLSHTQSLTSKDQPALERQVRMYIEDERGTQYPLTESAAGTYTAAARTLDLAHQYRLHFFTRAGQEYLSDFTEPKVTPPIDSLTWRADTRGVHVRVNTHDASGKSVYYRWRYDETWEFTSGGPDSKFEYRNGVMVDRQVDIRTCWASSPESTLRLGNSTRLSQDRIADFELTTLPPTDAKLRVKYSILVRQSAQTQAEYQYWELLRKNTESLGGLFDALPSQPVGNLRCLSNPDAGVLGYVGAYSVTEKRLFIDRRQLPAAWAIDNPYDRCVVPDTVETRDFRYYFAGNLHVPIDWFITPTKIRMLAMDAECADCRLHGTNVRPGFWQ